MMLNIQILFTDYAIIKDFLNLDFCSEHFIKKFNSDSLYAFKDKKKISKILLIFFSYFQ